MKHLVSLPQFLGANTFSTWSRKHNFLLMFGLIWHEGGRAAPGTRCIEFVHRHGIFNNQHHFMTQCAVNVKHCWSVRQRSVFPQRGFQRQPWWFLMRCVMVYILSLWCWYSLVCDCGDYGESWVTWVRVLTLRWYQHLFSCVQGEGVFVDCHCLLTTVIYWLWVWLVIISWPFS